MKLEEAKEFCNQWLPAFSGNRPEYLITFYSDDAYYSDSFIPQGLKGKAQILAYFRKIAGLFPNWKYEYVEIFPTENGFTLKWKLSLPGNNETFVDHGLDIVEIFKEKIIRNEVYLDTARLQKAIKHAK